MTVPHFMWKSIWIDELLSTQVEDKWVIDPDGRFMVLDVYAGMKP